MPHGQTIQALFGRHDVSQVRAEVGGAGGAAATQIGARAYATGDRVAFAETPDLHTAAHEAAHVVQQRTGVSLKGGVGQAGDAYEQHADRVADLVVAGESAESTLDQIAGKGSSPHAIQQSSGHAVQRIENPDASVATSGAAATAASPATAGAGAAAGAAPVATAAGAPATTPSKEEVKNRHLAQQSHVYAVMDAAKQGPATNSNPPDQLKLFANSVEWFQNGMARLVVLTPTHDTDTRNSKLGKAFFDGRVQYPQHGGDYPADATAASDSLVFETNPATIGRMVTDARTGKFTMWIYNPPTEASENEELRRTIIHETQHLADQHNDGQRGATPPPTPGMPGILDKYKSEFRAFSLAGRQPSRFRTDDFGSSDEPATNSSPVTLPHTKLQAQTAFKNARQENIFWHLVFEGYGFNYHYVMYPGFKAAVDAFDLPYSGNLVNSVRIENLSRAVDACKPSMNRVAPAVKEAFGRAWQLDSTDRTFLQDEVTSKPFWDNARAKLSPAVFKLFANVVKYQPSAPPPPGDYNLPPDTTADGATVTV
jgi:hypothetical protein